jgi:hypothetical protein
MDRAAGKGENNSYPALLWHIKQIELDKRLHLVPADRASWSYVSRTNKMGGQVLAGISAKKGPDAVKTR